MFNVFFYIWNYIQELLLNVYNAMHKAGPFLEIEDGKFNLIINYTFAEAITYMQDVTEHVKMQIIMSYETLKY